MTQKAACFCWFFLQNDFRYHSSVATMYEYTFKWSFILEHQRNFLKLVVFVLVIAWVAVKFGINTMSVVLEMGITGNSMGSSEI